MIVSCNHLAEVPRTMEITNKQIKQKAGKAAIAKMVYKSTDGGQTWQDISLGLPPNLDEADIQSNNFFVNDKGLFFKVGDEIYNHTVNTISPFWTKAINPGQHCYPAVGTAANHLWGIHLTTNNGTSVWSPIFEHYQEQRIRSAFQAASGAIFIGTDRGIFKTTDNGSSWKHVYAGALVGNMAESDGVLVSTSNRKVIRSTDNGDNWTVMTSEDNMTFDIKQVKGGFAAITSGAETDKRRLSTSVDGGKTWQLIHPASQNTAFIETTWQNWNDRPRLKAFQTSIIRVGENFFCTHPDGIFRSKDKGKTWTLLLPSVEEKVFSVFSSGKVIYAVSSRGGC